MELFLKFIIILSLIIISNAGDVEDVKIKIFFEN